ncbi:MAG: HAD-IB family phosphatase [Acidimicrobiia bacterium]|nr:HAD-IB family phosphatase [Acidimicrobiia bacterium]
MTKLVAMDLASASVFLDFDGTMTVVDSGVHLLQRLGDDSWLSIDELYSAGAIGSRECLEREWELLPHDETALREAARDVALDPHAERLVADLRGAGAEVTVVSDGFGFYADEVCARLGVPVLTNAVDWSTGSLGFPNLDRCCPCSSCGTCKQAPIKDARRRGRTTIFVGDGISDRKAALLADVLFAKDRLAEWCEFSGVEHVPFGTLADVHSALCS